MKKTIRTFLTLALMLMLCISCVSSAMAASVDPGYPKYCKYGSDESPCIYWFACNSSNRQHYCYCTQHTEDKEDKYAFMFVYGPAPCTLSNDICKYCEHDYSPALPAIEILMRELHKAIEAGRETFAVTTSGNTLSVAFSDYFEMVMLEHGIATETLLVPTEYKLMLTGGSTYAYTGSPIEPAILSVSEYGPGTMVEEYSLYVIDNISYTNNTNPGTATATVLFQFESLQGPIEKELSINFTITNGEETPDPVPDNNFTSSSVTDNNVTASGLLSEGASLTVTPISSTSSEYSNLFSTINSDTHTVLGSYEVKLTGEMSGPLTLAFPVSSEYEGLTLTVLHQKKDGTIERLNGNVSSGKLTIVVTELSPFVILAPTNDQPDEVIVPAVPAADDLPQTGDSSMLMLWASLLTAAASILFLLRRKTIKG